MVCRELALADEPVIQHYISDKTTLTYLTKFNHSHNTKPLINKQTPKRQPYQIHLPTYYFYSAGH